MAHLEHDLRSPLTGVVGFAALIRRQATDPKLQSFADRILESADRMQEIIASHKRSALRFPRVPVGATLIGIVADLDVTADVAAPVSSDDVAAVNADLLRVAVGNMIWVGGATPDRCIIDVEPDAAGHHVDASVTMTFSGHPDDVDATAARVAQQAATLTGGRIDTTRDDSMLRVELRLTFERVPMTTDNNDQAASSERSESEKP